MVEDTCLLNEVDSILCSQTWELEGYVSCNCLSTKSHRYFCLVKSVVCNHLQLCIFSIFSIPMLNILLMADTFPKFRGKNFGHSFSFVLKF